MGKVRVYCKTLNKWFNSIRSAARFANVDDWTMSRKMDVLGGFIDANGNEYERSVPMDTKNQYPEYSKTVKKPKRVKYRRRKNIIEEEKTNMVFADYPKIIQDLIQEKIVNMMQSKESWDKIKDFMKKTGCKALTIRVDDEK